MKKILTIAVVLGMAFVMLSSTAAGYGEQLQGTTQDAYDGTQLNGGNVTVVHVQDPGDIPVYSGDIATGGYGDYSWSAEGGTEQAWDTAPDTEGDYLYFIKEKNGYFAATHTEVTADSTIKPTQYNMVDRLEPIPAPAQNEVGTDYINITIPAPKYTDASLDAGGSTGNGTFDVVNSYAVFMRNVTDNTDWEYIGNAENFVDGPDAPLEPNYDDGIDPNTRDTGHFTFNTSTDGGLTLESDTDYEFSIRVNIGPSEAEGGYGGGLGSYTTWSAGGNSGTISTSPTQSEFGPGMLIPVVATVGIFVAITVYRRKKYE